MEAEIEARELARIIERFLDTLTVENRVLFMRRYWFSDSCKDIAEFMGLTEKNISVRLTRIREKLRAISDRTRGVRMNARQFAEAMSELDTKYIDEALNYKKTAKRPVWLKWGAIAACLCVIISLSVIIFHQDEQELLTTGGHLEIINVELVEWQSDGFKAVVVDTGNSSIFPVGAELTVIFREHNTEIVIDDGSSYGYGEIQTSDIEWPVGSIVEVSFGVYEKYDANREYENKVYAYRVELASQ